MEVKKKKAKCERTFVSSFHLNDAIFDKYSIVDILRAILIGWIMGGALTGWNV